MRWLSRGGIIWSGDYESVLAMHYQCWGGLLFGLWLLVHHEKYLCPMLGQLVM